jgi:hypothetical protein
VHRPKHLPDAATTHMSDRAKQALAGNHGGEVLGIVATPPTGDPGQYYTVSPTHPFDPAGWYYFNTTANQTFIGHPGERDIYVTDLAQASGGFGVDTITAFGPEDIMLFTNHENAGSFSGTSPAPFPPASGEQFQIRWYFHDSNATIATFTGTWIAA